MEYEGDFRRENSRTSFDLHAYASSVEVLRFYGFGNETQATEGQKYYHVHANQYLLYPVLTVRLRQAAASSTSARRSSTPRTTRAATSTSTP